MMSAGWVHPRPVPYQSCAFGTNLCQLCFCLITRRSSKPYYMCCLLQCCVLTAPQPPSQVYILCNGDNYMEYRTWVERNGPTYGITVDDVYNTGVGIDEPRPGEGAAASQCRLVLVMARTAQELTKPLVKRRILYAALSPLKSPAGDSIRWFGRVARHLTRKEGPVFAADTLVDLQTVLNILHAFLCSQAPWWTSRGWLRSSSCMTTRWCAWRRTPCSTPSSTWCA